MRFVPRLEEKNWISHIWTQNQHIHLSKTTKPPQIKRAAPTSHPLLLLLFRENKGACYIKLGKVRKSCQSFQIQGSRYNGIMRFRRCNRPQIAFDRKIHEKSHNLQKIAPCVQSTQYIGT